MRVKSLLFLLLLLLAFMKAGDVKAASMSQYCYVPPFAGAPSPPPLVMFVASRDHRLYYEAYNDASDLDEDGKLDVGYKHSIDYYGYFDPYKCYKYQNSRFEPIRKTNDKYCGGSDEWSGNFLNWLTMARIDVLRKVLYGGYRSTDSASETVLEATFIPQDAHSWGKEYNGSDTNLLTPFSQPSSGNRHLFCITSTSNGDTRKIRVLLDKPNRIWEWASKERPVCDNSLGTPSYEYYIRVKVCDPSVGLELNCKRYPGGGGTYKPIGLLQKYGEGDGTKWCSKSLKTCNTDSDCNPTSANGLCVDKGQMYFGLITGSYEKNMSGGVLRKNIWSILDETNANTGIFQSSENTPGNIILTFDRLKIVDFRYSDYSYEPGWPNAWVTTRPMNEGEFKNWGNPVGEMLYEALLYFAGKTSPTSSFTYSGNQDGGLNLPKPNWGKFTAGGPSYKLYDLFPICAKPFVITLSDINNSYDSDSVPGSSFSSFSGDLSSLDVSTLANTISSVEGISGNYFIGQSSSFYDFICSAKNVSSLATIRGLCPEEPTKQGSFYVASLAYYGNKKSGGWRDNFSDAKPSPIKTFSVALASPIPDIAVKVGGKLVRINPLGKSVSGCLNVYSSCAQKCSLTYSGGRLNITGCSSNSYCPTNQIVDFYVDTVNYDSDGNLIYAKFRINFEDVEQGADHDMDAIVEYEIQPVGSNQIKVKLTSSYAAGCIDQVLGFNISGTTEDGTWLVVKDRDANTDGDTPAVVGSMPLTWQRTFTVTGSTAGQLKPPLWYAAKWGGFDDMNGNDVPDLPQEWDKDGDGKPDTYFYVVNPLKLESELEKAFTEILKRASSGSTVATLAGRSNVSQVVVQPYFLPSYVRSDGTQVSWLGFLKSFWVDVRQNLREDTNLNKVLNLGVDLIFQLFFDTNTNETKASLISNIDTCTVSHTVGLSELKPVFDSGCYLADTNPSDRNIYYNKDGTLTPFTTGEASYLSNIWKVCSNDPSVLCKNNADCSGGGTCQPANASCIIRYLRGEDSPCSYPYVQRTRTVDVQDFCSALGMSGKKVWKLGDIISSSPAIAGPDPLMNYHFRYNDSTYYQYINSSQYKNRPIIAAISANDGMLHIFRIGYVEQTGDQNNPAKVVNSSTNSGNSLVGKEEFAFIPKSALPYLVWYGNPNYCHVPTVDYRVYILDAKVNGSWRTLLVGTMGFGGKAVDTASGTFSSSIFVLDLTDWLNNNLSGTPTLLWEKQLPDNTLTLSFPAVAKVGDSWYVLVGTGPAGVDSNNGESFNNNAYIYVFKLDDGSLFNSIEVPVSGANVAVGDIMPVDVNNDYTDDVAYFGVYGVRSNIGAIYGALYRLNFSTWGISQAFGFGSNPAPVFGAPNYTLDENNNFWVFFGTGKYLSNADKSISYTNYLIGYKDANWNGTGSVSLSSLTDTTGQTTSIAGPPDAKMCICDSNGCGLKDVYTNATGSMPEEASVGWYIKLTNEAIYSQPAVFGGLVNALSAVLPTDICSMEGSSKLYSLYYKSGTPSPRPSIISPNAVQGGQIKQAVDLGRGVPPFGQPFQITAGSGKEFQSFLQISTGVILKVQQQTAQNYEGRFLLWIEK